MNSKEKLESVLLSHLQVQDKEKEPLVVASLKLYLNIIGERVVEAVSPVSALSAAFTAAVLEYYAKEIRKKYDCDNRFVENLKAFISGKPIFPKAPAPKSGKKGAEK